MKVGFIGLGNMGRAMAAALLKAGHTVIGYNRTRQRAEELRTLGLQVANSIGDACAADAVITMLANDQAVEEVVFGKAGILDSLATEKAHISMSTISPALASRLGQAHGARKQAFISAPVLGRPEAASQSKLFIVAGGNEKDIEGHVPLFQAMGQKTIIAGSAPEAANLVKISCNMMIATMIEGLSETFALVKKSGLVEPRRFAEILTATILSGPIFQVYVDHISKENFEPGFKTSLALKDIELVIGASRSHLVPMPLSSLLRDRYLTAVANGLHDADWSVLALIALKESGIRQ